MSSRNKRAVVIVYEPACVGRLFAYLNSLDSAERSATDIVALNADTEYFLEERGMAFVSGRALRTQVALKRIAFAADLGRDILAHPSLSFFVHRGITLGHLFESAFQEYIGAL